MLCKNLDLKHFGYIRTGNEAVYGYVKIAVVIAKDVLIEVRAKITKLKWIIRAEIPAIIQEPFYFVSSQILRWQIKSLGGSKCQHQ